jgi:hypothetical protein
VKRIKQLKSLLHPVGQCFAAPIAAVVAFTRSAFGSPIRLAILSHTFMLTAAIVSVQAQSTVVYVDINNGVDNPPDQGQNGWGDDAYRFLQDAIVAAQEIIDNPQEPDEVEIWVAAAFDGNDDPIPYRPDQSKDHDWCDDQAQPGPTCCPPFGNCDRNASFHMQNNVRILGGFPPDPHTWNNGQGAMIDDRNPAAYETILSGDLDEDDDWDVYDGNDELLLDFFNYGENSFAVVRAKGGSFDYGVGDLCDGNCEEAFVPDGQGGWCSCVVAACAHESNCCPGVCIHCDPEICEDEGPSINNTAVLDGFTIRGARADDQNPGGGIYGVNAAPQILNCTIELNWASSSQGLGEDCILIGNPIGAAIYAVGLVDQPFRIEDCVIQHNFGDRATAGVDIALDPRPDLSGDLEDELVILRTTLIENGAPVKGYALINRDSSHF